MAAFASVTELGDLLGETMTGARQTQGAAAIELASGLIQGWTRQTLELVVDDTIILPGNNDWELVLPERPVVDVTAVTINGTAAVADSYRVVGGAIIRSLRWGGPAATVAVTYTHGYDPIPEDIRAVTLQLAVRMMSNPTGVRQESIGSYSVTYGGDDPMIGGLLESLGRYRRRLASVPFSRVNRTDAYLVDNA